MVVFYFSSSILGPGTVSHSPLEVGLKRKKRCFLIFLDMFLLLKNFFKDLFLPQGSFSTLRFSTLWQWSCQILQRIRIIVVDSNPGPVPRNSGALPISHHISNLRILGKILGSYSESFIMHGYIKRMKHRYLDNQWVCYLLPILAHTLVPLSDSSEAHFLEAEKRKQSFR